MRRRRVASADEGIIMKLKKEPKVRVKTQPRSPRFQKGYRFNHHAVVRMDGRKMFGNAAKRFSQWMYIIRCCRCGAEQRVAQNRIRQCEKSMSGPSCVTCRNTAKAMVVASSPLGSGAMASWAVPPLARKLARHWRPR